MILRDLDLLQVISARHRFGVHITVTTLDARLARLLEPKAPSPAKRLEAVQDWNDEEVKGTLDEVASTRGLSRTKGWQPIRAAVTGSTVSPPLPESIALLGKERAVARLAAAAKA